MLRALGGWFIFCMLAAACAGPGIQPAATATPAALRIATYNIRYGTADDGENHWDRRREKLLAQIAGFDAQVLGLQEALRCQIDAIAAVLPQHRWVGTDRRGGQQDEFVPIFYDADRFELVEHGQFWLAPEPDTIGAVGWDAALPRHCCWVVLQEHDGSGRFLVGNAHFDHRGEQARRHSAQVVAQRLLARGLPTVLLGDLNTGEDSVALTTLRQIGFRDSFRALHPDTRQVGTFHGFQGNAGGSKIDYVLCDRNWHVLQARIDQQGGAGPPYPSDHFAVLAELRLIP